MVINNEDQIVVIKAQMEVNIEEKRQVRLRNLKTTKDFEVLTNKKIYAKDKKQLLTTSPHPNHSQLGFQYKTQ